MDFPHKDVSAEGPTTSPSLDPTSSLHAWGPALPQAATLPLGFNSLLPHVVPMPRSV